MKKLFFLITITLVGFCSCNTHSTSKDKGEIKIEWVNELIGDYSFKDQWSYPEGVYRDESGQLKCDGLCPDRVYWMDDSTGKIFNDSIEMYYKLVDTTHEYHTIQCEASCYEFVGTDFIKAKQVTKDTVLCWTMCNAGTHCSLQMNITKRFCYPKIELLSVRLNSDMTFKCFGGFIKIDKKLWKKGIFKSEFNFSFFDPADPNQTEPMFWKGKIQTCIE